MEVYLMQNLKKRNVIVGQSGGPTAAINSSLAGVFRTAKERRRAVSSLYLYFTNCR